ncbi:hypothetical protein ACFWM1_20120 [Nocardia sp. NPDC058379]|uniref:hypothetical protein n=1 Tax=unclassified Nocardia TaxID=2637762 RepID=UPI003667B011
MTGVSSRAQAGREHNIIFGGALMTSTTTPAPRTDYGSPQIRYSPGFPAEHRRFVEKSIDSMIEHSSAETARRRADAAERNAITQALYAPLIRLARQDPDTADTLRKADDTPVPFDEDLVHPRDTAPHGIHPDATATLDIRAGTEIFAIPYHFEWAWHDPAGGRPFKLVVDRDNGRVAIDGRAGPKIGGAEEFVYARAGYGVTLHTDHEVAVTGRSYRTTDDHYSVGCGLGGSAIAEGGTDLTVFENGNFVTSAVDKRWRKRVSQNETDVYSSNGFGPGATIEVSWTMRPGNTYTFNVGAFVYAYRDDGLGNTWSQSSIVANIIFMSIFR